MLSCAGIVKRFGGVTALDHIDLTVGAGEVVGLIGPNGSGKSTLLNVISGFIVPDEGTIGLEGRDISRLRPGQRRRLGLSRTFQNLRLYGNLTVLDNLLIGLHLHYSGGRDAYWRWIPAVFGTPNSRKTHKLASEYAHAALTTVGLDGKARELVGNLSYGEQKRVELARATLMEPKLLVLDEPTAGLAPNQATELLDEFITPIRDGAQRAVLIAEHHLELVLRMCSRIAVLDSGRKIMDGLPQDVASNEEVIRIYVGT